MTPSRLLLAVTLLAYFRATPQALAAVVGVPHPSAITVAAGADSFAPQFSRDGRWLFFQSLANDLVPNDPSPLTLDLFRYEPASDTLVRVSAEPVAGGKPADWISPVTSADGDLVIFTSLSTAIVAGKTNARVMDIFWKRVSSGEMGLVSVSSNGISGGNADSREPVMSSDGRYVAFESDATDLAPLDSVAGPTGSVRSVVYLRDLQRSEVVAISAPRTTNEISLSGHLPSLASDGLLTAFYTESLSPPSGSTRLVVRNNLTEEVVWSYTMDRYTGGNCRSPQLSPDGRRVAFFSRETNARMRLAVHDLQTGDDYSLTNNFFLCAPIVWSANSRQVYVETFFQIGSWDFQTGDVQWQNLRSPASTAGSASWSGLAVSADSSFVVYRDNTPLPDVDGARRPPGLFLREWPDGQTNLLTLDPTGAPAVQQEIGVPVLSPDNRWVAFEASDSTLTEGDLNRSMDIFLHDRQTGTTRLISRHRVTQPATTGSGNLAGKSWLAGANRLLAFSAGDGNYVAGDTNRSLDVFVQDLSTGDTRSVTLRQPGFAEPYQRYLSPQLSVSGDVIAFLGYGVSSSGFPLATELHVVNLSSGDHQTVKPPGNDLGIQGYLLPPAFHLSANGQRIAFESHTTNSRPNSQILVRDLQTGTNRLVSANSNGNPGNGDSTQPWVSPDTKRVIFVSTSTDLLPQPVIPSLPVLRRLYERDLESGTNRLLSTNLIYYSIDAPVVSPDGRYASFRMGGAPRTSEDALARVVDLSNTAAARTYPGVRQVYGFDQRSRYAVGLMTNASDRSLEGTLCRLDLKTGETLTFPAGRGAGGLGFWLTVTPDSPPVISADGRYIVFESPDDSLVSGDNNRLSDLFVRDTQEGVTLPLILNRSGTGSGNGLSTRPVLSADGKALVFQSRASDLVDGDFNTKKDLFILTFDLPDSDSDGLPDDWEMTYFGSLSRDGTGDFDSDGQTDAAEYQAGTDPTGAGSFLRVLTLQSSGGQGTKIIWAAVVGKHYRVEYKDSITQVEWIAGAADYLAASNTGRWTDPTPSPAGQRFYRVVVLK